MYRKYDNIILIENIFMDYYTIILELNYINIRNI